MRLLVTGGAGFIGSNFIHYILAKYPDYKIINLDALTYAGNLDNLRTMEEKYGRGVNSSRRRYWFVKGDIRDKELVTEIMPKVTGIINFAAESHVDRSILNPQDFLSTNILGTHTLLEAARKYDIKRFLHISTDEVYGSIEQGYFSEDDSLNPNSPYSSSKASADLLVMAYFKTFGLPTLITRTTNNFGPYQHPEKFIPLFITNFLDNEKVPLYGYGLNRRDWIYVEDNCEAIDLVFHRGRVGEIYNIGTNNNELPNIEISSRLAYLLNRPPRLIEFTHDRPGHDYRYGIAIDKIRRLGWRHKHNFEDGLLKTIEWYRKNEWWWRKIKKNAFKNYSWRSYSM